MKLIPKCNSDIREVLIKKLKINFAKLLTNNHYCSLCFSSETQFNNFEDEIIVNIWERNNTVSLKSILEALFGDTTNQGTSGSKICSKCTEGAVQAYKFIQNAKISSNVIEEFIDSTENYLTEIECDSDVKYTSSDADEAPQIKEEYKKQHETQFTCKYCNILLESKYSFLKHLKICPKKIQYKKHLCTACKTIECEHEKYLKSFKEQIKQKKTIKCPDCNLVCGVSKPAFLKHVNEVHLNIITNICEICAKQFHSNSAYWNHSRVHLVEKYKCQYCEENFENNKSLQEHYAVCAKIKRKFKCEKCPASFNTQLSLLQHEKKHADKHTCKICGIVVKLTSLRIHQRLHQNNMAKSKYPCSVCNENFSSTRVRAKHMKEYHKPGDKHKSNTKINHGFKRHKCPKCDYATTSLSALDAHINRFHLKITPYSCKICQKTFAGALRRDDHMKIHSDEKIFQCESCGKHLASKSALKKHIMLHTGARPYKCDVCEKRFISSSVRNIHKIKSHTDKTIKCPLCEQMFHTLPNMRSHFKKKHWNRKGESFDVRKVNGLKEEDYELFRDRRMLVIE